MRHSFADWDQRPGWMQMPQLASRVFYTPLIIDPRKLTAILSYLSPRFGAHSIATNTTDGSSARLSSSDRDRKPYDVIERVAVIDVFGTLVHRSSWMNAWSGISSYEQLGAELDEALDDGDVDTILLLVDSPGGECSGAWDFADKVFNARSQKRIVAIAEDMAASAGYLIASSAEELYTTQTGVLGSIGVVLTHYDVTQNNQKWGIKVTEIHAGARKVDCSPNQVLDDEKLTALQAHVNAFYDLFVEKVSRNRGLSAEAVRATEAGIYVGAEAVQAGLADDTRSLEELMSILTGHASGIAVPQAPNARSGSMKPHAGENLGNLLEESIGRQVSEERSREDVVQEMADSAGTDSETVETILSGELNCPTRETLDAFSSVLDLTVDEMIVAAEEDGCDYSEESADDSASEGAGDESPESSASRRGRRDKGEAMKDKGGAVSLRAQRDKAVARAESAEAALAEVKEARKRDVIDKHQKAGRVTPAMLPSVQRLAATCDSAEELDELLAAYPTHIHTPGAAPVDGTRGDAQLTEEEARIYKQLGVSNEAARTYGRVRGLQIGRGGVVEALLDDETVVSMNDIRGEA